MESAIDLFLISTCRVTPRWFNKPKFHLILHLPAHVKRFGPAMLFATEGFESFNAVIRSASIHSNRHAPSRDIAHRMAKGNRVRHLLSGGVFLMNRLWSQVSSDGTTNRQRRTRSLANWMEQVQDPNILEWHTAGLEALKLLTMHNFGDRILGIQEHDEENFRIGWY